MENNNLPYLDEYNYNVIKRVPDGKGSFGTVYLAHATKTGQMVAVKRLHQKYTNDNEERESLKREASRLLQFNSKYIVKLYDFISKPHEIYIITEFVFGQSLKKYISENKKVNKKEFIHIFRQVLSGLDQIHRKGISHLDIKPSNIMLDNNLGVKIVDLGIAQAINEDEGIIVGTKRYMSPEQTRGDKLIFFSDIYSLGVTMITALLGESPYQGLKDNKLLFWMIQNVPLIMHENGRYFYFQATRNKRTEIKNLSLAKFLAKATAKEESKRYSSCRAMYKDLMLLNY